MVVFFLVNAIPKSKDFVGFSKTHKAILFRVKITFQTKSFCLVELYFYCAREKNILGLVVPNDFYCSTTLFFYYILWCNVRVEWIKITVARFSRGRRSNDLQVVFGTMVRTDIFFFRILIVLIEKP